MACWNKTKVHVAGVPLSSVAADCRLVGPFGCDGVWKAKGTTCASSSCLRVNDESLACRVAPGLQLVWKRGPLAPVVVVGEGQVNLVYGGRVVAMGKVSKALWLMIDGI